MPAVSVEQFWDLLSAARLQSADDIVALRRDYSTATPERIAQRLVETDRVTRWQAQMLLTGRTRFFLGKYKLLDKLGEGGMGAVFKAEQTPLGRIVALKLMSEELVSSESSVARFRREIQAAAALNHPNIVLAYDADCVGNTHFLVMEYVEGEDLASLARRRGVLPVGEACRYVLQAANGLAHASQRGLIHRDIKPANLVLSLSENPLVKILDFGLAKLEEQTEATRDLTATGQVMGTPDYIAPEQARNTRAADARSDIYSLGCTLFRLISGRAPFPDGSVMERLMAKVLNDPPSLKSLHPETPDELDAVVAKMIARRPDDRFSTPADVITALTPFATVPVPQQNDTVMLPPDNRNRNVELVAIGEEDLVTDPDSAYARFLGMLSNEPSNESLDDTDSRQYAATIPHSEAEHHSAPPDPLAQPVKVKTARDVSTEPVQKEKSRHNRRSQLQRDLAARKRGERRRFRWMAIGIVAFIAVFTGFGIWIRTGKTTIVVVWPKNERDASRLRVDGEEIDLPDGERVRFAGNPGTMSVRLTRAGYEPVEETWELGRGEEFTFRPKWIPTPDTTRRQAFAALDKRVNAYIKENRRGHPSGAPDFNAPTVNRLRDDLRAFGRKYSGHADAEKSASLLLRLPSPFDNLNPATRPVADPPLAKSVPLVAVLGTPDLRLKHWNELFSVSFSRDGKWLASNDWGELKVWDATTGKHHTTIRGGRRARFSPDGKFLIHAGNPVTLRDAATFEKLRSVDAKVAYSFAVSPDSRMIATGAGTDSAGIVHLWDVATGKKLRTLEGHTGRIVSIAFSRDHASIATFASTISTAKGTGDNTVRLWATATGKLIRNFGVHLGVKSIAFHPDGKRLFSAGGKVIAWNIQTGNKEQIKAVVGHQLRFSHNEKLLAAAYGETVTVYDAETLQTRATLPAGHGDYGVHTIAFSHDDRLLATGNSDGTVSIWSLETQKEIAPVSPPAGTTTALAVSPDGRWIATGGMDRIVRVWDSSTGKQRFQLKRHRFTVNNVEFSPDGRMIASCAYNGEVRLWDATKGSYLRTVGQGQSRLRFLAFRPDGTEIAVGSSEGNIRFWNPKTGHETSRHALSTRGVFSAAYSPDGKWLALGMPDGMVRLWNPKTDQLKWERKKLPGHIHTLRFSSDGKTLAVGCDELFVLSVATSEKVRTHSLRGIVAYSHDDSLLARTIYGKLQVMNAKSGDVLDDWRIGPPLAKIQKIAFAPDGRHLVTANGNGTIYVLRLQDWEALQAHYDAKKKSSARE